jgi:hypothetical protein
MGFLGFVTLGSTTFGFPIQCVNSSGTPTAPDAAPTWRIYAASGGAAILNGTGPGSDTDSQTGYRFITGVNVTLGNNFAAGQTFYVRAQYAISSVNFVLTGTFAVV